MNWDSKHAPSSATDSEYIKEVYVLARRKRFREYISGIVECSNVMKLDIAGEYLVASVIMVVRVDVLRPPIICIAVGESNE